LLNRPRIRFAEKGNVPGQDVYAAFGKPMAAGIWLFSLFISQQMPPLSSLAHVIWNPRNGDGMLENKLSSISQADTLEKMGEFWDTHDFTQFDTDAPDIEYTINFTVAIEPDLLAAVEKQAQKRGIGVETLINLWLQEKLMEQLQPVAV
jgi:hypothetical protein